MPRLGAHMSIAGGLDRALVRGQEAGCDVVQIFTQNRAQWKSKKLSTYEVETFGKTREKVLIDPVATHNSYLINLASPRPDVFQKSFHAFLNELERAELLNIPYVVMHPGAHLGDGEKKGLRRIGNAIGRLFARTGDYRVKILLETTAGQGTSLGYRFEHLTEIMEKTGPHGPHDRIGVCFDTCHAFAAGYDFRTEKSYEALLREFDRIVGLDRLKLFHVNDSKKELGSRVDRHEHPGKGCIGLEAFSFFLGDPIFVGHPFLIETPKGKDNRGMDLDVLNLNALRKLFSVDPEME